MNILYQVCSYELAKKLNNNGVKQDSFFYYRNRILSLKLLNESNSKYIGFSETGIFEFILPNDNFEIISAFTLSELSEILPNHNESGKRIDDYVCRVYDEKKSEYHVTISDSHIDAIAKMICWKPWGK